MRHHPSGRNSVWTVLLSVLAVLVLSACGDADNVAGPESLSPDAKLSSLTVTPGTLQPAFSGDVANYSMDVTSNVASAAVTAQPQDSGATVSINGQTTSSRSVSLGAPGSSTPLTIVVTAPNGSQNIYIVTMNRAALAGNNSLQSVTVSPGALAPTFNANTLNYFVNVDSPVANVSVKATLQDARANMTVNGQAATSGQARNIPLNGANSSTPITIIVTAQNGTQKTYSLAVQRAAFGGNNNLQNLTVSPGAFFPAFNANTLSYFVNVDSPVANVSVKPTLQDTRANMTVNGQGTNSGQARTITLFGAGSSTPITIIVTAQNGTQKTYSLAVQRAAFGGNSNLQSRLSGNNNLSALEVSAGALDPTFDAGTTSFDVSAPIGTADTMITATIEDSTATLTINDSPATSGAPSPSITLEVGTNSIPIFVTAENGSTKAYTITITRLH